MGIYRTFEITDENRQEFLKWWNQHSCRYHNPPEGSRPAYGGAIGGMLTYKFTDTSIGTVINAKCACGEEVCINGEYEL